MIAPFISKNGTIGICSPSHVAQYDEYQETIMHIKEHGFSVIESPNLYKATYGYLATPKERADDFNQLVSDPRVELIFFGGGEGANELLPYIDFENIKRHPKRMGSYSDGTTILDAVWANTGLETYYGQAPHLLNIWTPYEEENFQKFMIEGTALEHIKGSTWQVQTEGTGEGILIGGYLRNFAMMLYNPYFPIDMKKDYILFLEDHEVFGGIDYVSSMLTHIEQSGFMKHVKGLLFGNYSEKEEPFLLGRLKRLGEEYHIPVIHCDDYGHGDKHAILQIGHKAVLDTTTLSLRYE